MDLSRCYQRSVLSHSLRHNCSCKAFSSPRLHESRPKLRRSLLRQQHECLRPCAPQQSAQTPLMQLQSRVCSTSTRPTQAVSTAAHEPSTANRQAIPGPPHLAGMGAAAALLAVCTGGAAFAAEVGDAQVSQGPDLLTTVLFSATILALLILTVGVVYLSATSFLDRRTETEARKKFEEVQKSRELQAANAGKPKVKRRRTQDELSRGGGKGFGG